MVLFGVLIKKAGPNIWGNQKTHNDHIGFLVNLAGFFLGCPFETGIPALKALNFRPKP